jgi:hypothetical protein
MASRLVPFLSRATHGRIPRVPLLSRPRAVPSSSTRPSCRPLSTSSDPPAAPLDTGEQAIYDKLASRFPGEQLQVQDVSGPYFALDCGALG